MQCPLCRDASLEPHYRNGVEIDVCPTCRGIWLDRGEIDRLAGPPPAATVREAGPKPDPHDRATGKKSKKKRKKTFADRLADVLDDIID